MRTQRALSMSGFVYVDCVAGSVCGNMHNAQSKARAGGLYVDYPGYCLVAQVGSQPTACRSVACPLSSIPTDMVECVLFSLRHCLAGHQKDRGSLVNGTTSTVAVCTGRGTQTLPPPRQRERKVYYKTTTNRRKR